MYFFYTAPVSKNLRRNFIKKLSRVFCSCFFANSAVYFVGAITSSNHGTLAAGAKTWTCSDTGGTCSTTHGTSCTGGSPPIPCQYAPSEFGTCVCS